MRSGNTPLVFKLPFMCPQAFKLENPSWLKYLQIRQLSHHGTEAVCALNDVCVYGKSAAEDLEDRLSQVCVSSKRDASKIRDASRGGRRGIGLDICSVVCYLAKGLLKCTPKGFLLLK
jgi:hypothetical protein